MSGEKDATLTLEWGIRNIPLNYTITTADLKYSNNTIKGIQVADLSSQQPSVTELGISTFGNRLKVALVGTTYQLTITELKYTDVGSYELTMLYRFNIKTVGDIKIIQIMNVKG